MNGQRLYYATGIIPLVFVIVCVGCTAIGYVIGDAIDEKHAHFEPVGLSPDSCHCEKGDRVKLILVTGDSLTGRVNAIKAGEYVRVMTRCPDPVTSDKGEVVQIPWADIQSIEMIKKPIEWRIVLTTTGILMDVIIYTAIRAIRNLSGAFESMGA